MPYECVGEGVGVFVADGVFVPFGFDVLVGCGRDVGDASAVFVGVDV